MEVSDDIIVLFQEVSDEDVAIAKGFDIKHIGLAENVGIGQGIITLFNHAKYETVLFLEHDWELIENKKTLTERLKSGMKMLDEGFDIVRYRSRKNPGHPLYSSAYKGRELDYFDDWHLVKSPHLLDALHWLDPAREFPDKIQKKGEHFVTTARWANWTNNPFMIRREFYFQNITPFIGQGIQLEKNIASWWVNQPFKIAQGEGLFTHNDLKKHGKPSFVQKVKTKLKKLFS